LYEVYDKEQAWVDHRKAPHFLAFMEVGNRAIVSREATKLTGVNIKS
jgi:quinol monooxygenase YgiN